MTASTTGRLRSAAFGSLPGIDDREAVAAATTSPRCAWLAAVVLGARGRYAAASTLLRPLIHGPDPLLASLACATSAAHRRQLGGHAAALPLDGAAARLAATSNGDPDEDGVDPAGALADALLGLAADNLALARTGAARRLLARVNEMPMGWRTTVRAGWVGAELALATGNAQEAVPSAERAVKLAADRGAVRHSVKSDLVLAAALAATGDTTSRRRAARLVDDALVVAERHALRSLIWPGALLAADVDPENANWNHSRVTHELYALLLATDPQGRRLARKSVWVPETPLG